MICFLLFNTVLFHCLRMMRSYLEELLLMKPDSMLVQQDLTSLFTWSGDNHLVFNYMKSVVVSFRKSCSVFSCNFQYNISGNTLDTIPLQKDLGVCISHDLSWSDHCYKIVSCAMKQLYPIRRSFQY